MKVDFLTTPQNQVSTFGSDLDCYHFQEELNLLHPALKFTIEKEQNNSLHFLDVLVEKEGTGFQDKKDKKDHRALMICSKTTLGSELEKIKQLLIKTDI